MDGAIRILLIEDDVVLRNVLAQAIKRRGLSVAQADSRSMALRLLGGYRPTHVLLDLTLAGDFCLDLISVLRASLPEVRVVVLTGHGYLGHVVQAIKAGAADYLVKPAINVDDVLFRLIDGRSGPELSVPPPLALLDRERMHLEQVMADCGGNISKAASILKIHRRSLQRKLDKFAPHLRYEQAGRPVGGPSGRSSG